MKKYRIILYPRPDVNGRYEALAGRHGYIGPVAYNPCIHNNPKKVTYNDFIFNEKEIKELKDGFNSVDFSGHTSKVIDAAKWPLDKPIPKPKDINMQIHNHKSKKGSVYKLLLYPMVGDGCFNAVIHSNGFLFETELCDPEFEPNASCYLFNNDEIKELKDKLNKVDPTGHSSKVIEAAKVPLKEQK